MRRALVRLAIVLGTILGGSIAASSGAMASTTITVDGAVSCSYHNLVGVWVQSSGGGSGFAGWDKGSNGDADGVFSTTITTTLPTTLSLHVGCGNTRSDWWSDNWTPGISVTGSAVLQAACDEGTSQPPAGANTRCSFGTTRSETAAINWAESKIHENVDSGLCFTFVTTAYGAANVTLGKFYSGVAVGPDTYPQDAWGHFTQGIVGLAPSTPPPGALVFFNQTGPHDGYSQASGYYSHVELSLGGGNMISTADQTTADPQWTVVHYETLAQHGASGAWNKYVGWWLPA
jgi:hypothetical protein